MAMLCEHYLHTFAAIQTCAYANSSQPTSLAQNLTCSFGFVLSFSPYQ